MYHPPFIARERELAVLDREWQAPGARLLILFGRRRNGKTRLITHWIGGKQSDGVPGRTGDVYDPATGTVSARVAFASEAEVGPKGHP